ncbi:hypothetical protein [Vampirovibrio chlorellavorus]|uniref:hypothetical protein n=1 Tax=Vampirovibrio chlorellavorus TaxID=758823 RepID=UPI0026F12DB0|nr:hypothetical protein [Vampirovibrio chlorellavorus]
MSSLPPLIFYPLYPGGPQVRATNAWLNANSSFRTQANQFVPAYGVNLPTDLRADEADTYYTLSGNRTISRRPVSQASPLSAPLGFDATVVGGLKRAAVPAVAPVIPNVFKAAERLLAVSELNMTELLALPEFRLPNIGLGLKVTTDGQGGVDTVGISPGVYGSRLPLDATNPDFGGLNRAEITTGATFKVTDLSIDPGPAMASPMNASKPSPAPNLPIGAEALNVNPRERTAGIFKLQEQALQALQSLDPEAANLNALLQRLEQLDQLASVDPLPKQTEQALGSATEGQQLAANRAGLGVKPSQDFQSTVAGLINANKQSESYASAFAPRMDQVMNGKIAGSPWMGGQSANAGSGGLGNAGGFEMGAAVADAMSRKGKGGSYVPFQRSSGGESGFANANPFMGSGGGLGAGSGFSAFGGQADPNAYRPRKPLAFTA